MSEDEMIHMLQSYVGMSKKDNHRPILDKAIETLLDLYQKQKEKNKELERYKKYYESEKIVWYKGDYISKDKIKEFIEENTRTGRGYNEYEEGLIDENDRIIDKLSKMIEEN